MLLNEDGGYRLYPNGVPAGSGVLADDVQIDTAGG
jgi:hypothetical protein